MTTFVAPLFCLNNAVAAIVVFSFIVLSTPKSSLFDIHSSLLCWSTAPAISRASLSPSRPSALFDHPKFCLILHICRRRTFKHRQRQHSFAGRNNSIQSLQHTKRRKHENATNFNIQGLPWTAIDQPSHCTLVGRATHGHRPQWHLRGTAWLSERQFTSWSRFQ